MGIVKVAISGKRLSGKSTASKCLLEHALKEGFNAHILSHSTWIKYLAVKGLNLKPNREALQKFGTEVIINGCDAHFRCPEFWTNMVISDANDLVSNMGVDYIIVDDLRFDFQAEALRNDGYILVRLKTTIDFQKNRDNGKDEGIINHISETALDHLEGKGFFDIEFSPSATISGVTKGITDYIALKGKIDNE